MNQTIVSHSPKASFSCLDHIKSCFGCICPCFYPNVFGSQAYKALDLGPQKEDRKTLVLDLDETLVHSSVFPTNFHDFQIEVSSGGQSFTFYVHKRPDLDAFLKLVSDIYEVVIFTASLESYANPVIDLIAPWIPLTHRFFRKHCISYNGFFVKDVSRLNRPISSILICDNAPISYVLNRKNGIEVKSFMGEKDDKELLSVLYPLLKKLVEVPDVTQVYLKQKSQ